MGGNCNHDGHTCVHRPRFRIGLRLAKEKQLTFNLGEKLAPKMHRHGGQASTEYADHVVIEHLDGLLGKVAAMVVGGDKFVCHLGEFNFGFVHERCLVIEYLVPWDDAALSHLCMCVTAGKNEFTLVVVLECLAPGGVEVPVVEDHDVVVAEAGDERETTCLVRVQCVLQINDPDEDVMCNNVCSWHGVLDRRRYVGGICVVGGNRGINGTSGLDALALSLHVTHLSLL
jgi:hypothetical protein